jgi:hypothetical protein
MLQASGDRSTDKAAPANSASRSSKSVPIWLLKRCASGEANINKPKAGCPGAERKANKAKDAAWAGSANH